MSERFNTRVVLAARPSGRPALNDFRIEEQPIPNPAEGEVLLKVLFLSLDPYMRGRMDAAKSYAAPVEIGAVMEGGTVAEVIESRHPDYSPGDIVLSHSGWQTHALAKGEHLRKLDPEAAPISTALGVLGMPGFTAYSGLLTIGAKTRRDCRRGCGQRPRRLGGRTDRQDQGSTCHRDCGRSGQMRLCAR